MSTLLFTASKKKYRFASNKGALTVEDLFDMSLPALDAIAINIDEQISKLGRKSFVNKATATNTDLSNQLEIVKMVIEHKQAEDEARKTRAAKEASRAFLGELKKKKELEQLEGMSMEEIQKQLDALE